VSDKGFDFQPPPPRRQPREFEPPPWEKDQFEQLARERAEQERIEREAALVAQAEAEKAASEHSAEEDAGAGEQVAQAALPQSDGSTGVAETAPAGVEDQPAAEPRAVLDERQVELLLLGLREEEPETLAGMWLVSSVAGAVVVVVGLAIGLWGTAAMFNRSLGSTGKLGGTVLVVFGLAFVGVGGWLVYRALRQRGVL
jgi:hypothetical protein